MVLSAIQQVTDCDFGEACYHVGDDPRPQVALLVRERSAMIRYLGETPAELLPGIFLEENCLVVTVLLRAGRMVRQIYPVWWDYHAPGGPDAFQLMERQEYLAVYLHGDGARRERTFVLENSLADFFGSARQQAARLPAWTPDRFNSARREVCSRAGGIEGLWVELAGKTPPESGGVPENQS